MKILNGESDMFVPQAYDTDGVAVDGMAKGVVGKTVTFAGRSEQQAESQWQNIIKFL